MKTIGDTAASGELTVITLRTRFDEDIIASGRGGGERPLIPGPIAMALVDLNGHRYPVSGAGQPPGTPPMAPGTFEAGVLAPGRVLGNHLGVRPAGRSVFNRLLFSSVRKPSLVLIGDEDSPRHQKTYLGL